eukprot:5783765-Pyramimonas_sp.AAC.1
MASSSSGSGWQSGDPWTPTAPAWTAPLAQPPAKMPPAKPFQLRRRRSVRSPRAQRRRTRPPPLPHRSARGT